MKLRAHHRQLLQRIADGKGTMLAITAQPYQQYIRLFVEWGLIRMVNHPTAMNKSRRRPALALEITPRGLERLAERVHGDEDRLNMVIGDKAL
jgi:hypothetical protein